MSPESFTNVLLITLISLITTIAGVGYKKLNELITEVKNLVISDVGNKRDIVRLQDDLRDLETRVEKIEDAE